MNPRGSPIAEFRQYFVNLQVSISPVLAYEISLVFRGIRLFQNQEKTLNHILHVSELYKVPPIPDDNPSRESVFSVGGDKPVGDVVNIPWTIYSGWSQNRVLNAPLTIIPNYFFQPRV
jgi:hypothetical protein